MKFKGNRRGPDRPVIRDRGGHDDDVGGRRGGVERGLELGGALDRDDRDTDRRRDRAGAQQQRDLGPPALRSGGERGAHLARAAVADEPRRIDGLVGRPRGDHDALARQVLRRQQVRRGFDDVRGLGEPAGLMVGGDWGSWQYGPLSVLELAVATRAVEAHGALEPEMAAWLRGHGITANTSVPEKAGGVTGQLENIAANVGAGVVIAGAYGHSRLREWVLSGVTRHLATESRRCAFLSR
jgi:nucleotide-binding universal stress UspA family protein